MFSGISKLKIWVSFQSINQDLITLFIKVGDSSYFIVFSILSLFSTVSHNAEILYVIFLFNELAFIHQETYLLVHASMVTFLFGSAISTEAVNFTSNQILSLVLLKIFAQISDTSESLKISGVLSSIITFCLTSINSSEYQNKLSIEFDITITLKLVKLSGRLKLILAFQLLSVITLGL
jgi:hypothetical protein